MAETKCKSCGAAIFWAKTVTGKNVPINEQTVAGGNVIVTDRGVAKIVGIGEGNYESHFATCPNADAHRKKMASNAADLMRSVKP